MTKRKITTFVAILMSVVLMAGIAMFAVGCGGGDQIDMRVTAGSTGNSIIISLEEDERVRIEMVDAVGASAGRIDWESLAPNVATVRNGVVTPVSVGRAVITATVRGGATTQIIVYVVSNLANAMALEYNAYEAAETTIARNGDVITRAVGRPLAVTSRMVGVPNSAGRNWTSSAPEVVSVAFSGAGAVGNLTLHTVGTAVITVTSRAGNVTTSFTINVIPRAEGAISLAAEFFEMTATVDALSQNWYLENDLDFTDVEFHTSNFGARMIGLVPVNHDVNCPNGTDCALSNCQFNSPVLRPFRGIFDGRGHTINGIYMSVPYQGSWHWGRGLFHATNGATIRNVAFTDMTWFSNTGESGALIGSATNTTIENVFMEVDALWGYWGNRGPFDAPGGIVGNIIGTTTLTNVVADITSLWGNAFRGPIGAVASNAGGSLENVFVTGSGLPPGTIGSTPQVWVQALAASGGTTFDGGPTFPGGASFSMAPLTVNVDANEVPYLQHAMANVATTPIRTARTHVLSVDEVPLLDAYDNPVLDDDGDVVYHWQAQINVLHGYIRQRIENPDHEWGFEWGDLVHVDAITLQEDARRVIDEVVHFYHLDIYEPLRVAYDTAREVYEAELELYLAGEIAVRPTPPAEFTQTRPVITPAIPDTGFGSYASFYSWNSANPGSTRISTIAARNGVDLRVYYRDGAGFVPGFLSSNEGSFTAITNVHTFARAATGAQNFSALPTEYWTLVAGQLPRLNRLGGLPEWKTDSTPA